MTKKRLFGLVLITLVTSLSIYFFHGIDSPKTKDNKVNTNIPLVYSLKLLSGNSYTSDEPELLRLAIESQSQQAPKNFTKTDKTSAHLLVIRKDRTNFQHFHPTLNTSNGTLSQKLVFAQDGDYQISLGLTGNSSSIVKNSPKFNNIYANIKVGDTSNYLAQPPLFDKLVDINGEFNASLYFPPSDDSPSASPNINFFATKESTIAVFIYKNKQPYKNLELSEGLIGQMTVFGPDLIPINAVQSSPDINDQTGLVIFSLKFPKSGLYKIFLQTRADGQETIFDLAISVKDSKAATSSIIKEI